MAIIFGLAGVAVGFLCWSLVASLTKGLGPFGSSGALELLCFLGPFAFLGPCFVRLANRQAWLSLIWLAALSPILSIALNLIVFALAVSVANSGANKDITLWVAIGSATLLWVAIGHQMVKSGWTQGS